MKKLGLVVFILLGGLRVNAQIGKVYDLLERLEERIQLGRQHLDSVSLSDKKFVLIKDFEDHIERQFIIFKTKSVTYVEVFDDKQNGQSSSNIFMGDVVRKKDAVSVRLTTLENRRLPIPMSKNLILAKQGELLYLVDANTKDRWMDQEFFEKQQNKKKQ